MNISIERITGDSEILNQIYATTKCLHCQKMSLTNVKYNQPCHTGVYCSDCISYCQSCCRIKGETIPQLESLMKSVSIKCKNSGDGCAVSCPVNKIVEHESICAYNKAMTSPFALPFKSMTLNSLYDPMDAPLPYSQISQINLLNSKLASLDKRVDGLESQKASMELKFVIQKQEYTKQINDFKSLTDTSFKSFMERFIADRDMLWAKLVSLEKQVVYIDKQIQVQNSSKLIPNEITNGSSKMLPSLSDLEGNPRLANSVSDTFASITCIDTLENMHSNKRNIIEAKTKDIIIKDDIKIPDVIASNERMTIKLSFLNDAVNDILKSLCDNCDKSNLEVNNDSSFNLCSCCNAIFCSDCVKPCACMTCHRKVCIQHSIKCAMCSLRTCKDKKCRVNFMRCQLCSASFCEQHLEDHKKFIQTEPYKLTCTTKTCKVVFDIRTKGFQEFANELKHARALTEIRIGIVAISQQRVTEGEHDNFNACNLSARYRNSPIK